MSMKELKGRSQTCAGFYFHFVGKIKVNSKNNNVGHEMKPGKYNSKYMKNHLYIQANGSRGERGHNEATFEKQNQLFTFSNINQGNDIYV